MIIQLFLQRVCYVENDPVHIDWLSFLATLSEQGANAIEHLTRTMPATFYPNESRPYFVMIRSASVQAIALRHQRLS